MYSDTKRLCSQSFSQSIVVVGRLVELLVALKDCDDEDDDDEPTQPTGEPVNE